MVHYLVLEMAVAFLVSLFLHFIELAGSFGIFFASCSFVASFLPICIKSRAWDR